MAPRPRSGSRSPHAGLSTAHPLAGPFGLLAQFTYLQSLDLLTTLVFLSHGVLEANPLVRFAMAATHSRLAGLLALKVCAFAGALYAVRTGRRRLLARMNVFFAALVIWNLLALLAR